MQTQLSTQAAKEFLVRCIVDEARREGSPLSDIERDMLYFSETAWTLPNIFEVNEAFEREYNEVEYENRIERLIANFKRRVQREDSATLEGWNRAVSVLASEDHYLLVMIGAADRLRIGVAEPFRRRNRLPQLILVGLITGMAALLLTFAILFIARR